MADMPRILLVDDDHDHCELVQDELSGGSLPCQVVTVYTGQGCIDHDLSRFDLVLLDYGLPDMDGLQCIEQLRGRHETPIVMVTGENSGDLAVEALQKGASDYVIKAGDYLRTIPAVVRKTLEAFRIQQENKRLQEDMEKLNRQLLKLNERLEQRVSERTAEIQQKKETLAQLLQELETGFHESLRVFAGLIEMRNRAMGGHSRRTAALAKVIAERMQLQAPQILRVEIAALLHDIGKLGFPDHLFGIWEDHMKPDERRLFLKHPVLGQASLHPIAKLKEVGQIVRHHHERWDGEGFPDRLRGKELSIEARIVAVANDCDRLLHLPVGGTQGNREAVLKFLLRNRASRYDGTVVEALVDCLEERKKVAQRAGRERVCSSEALKVGMILARDLHSEEGVLLLSRGTKLTPSVLEQIKIFASTGGFQKVHVFSESAPSV